MIKESRGTILITSLWIMAILSILAIGIGFRISIEARLAKYGIDGVRATYLSRAGIYKSMELLSKKSAGLPDSIRQCGIVLRDDDNIAHTLQGMFGNVKLGEGTFTVAYHNYPGMSDEERKLNINTNSYGGIDEETVLMNLLDSLNLQSLADATTIAANKDIAHAIVMWRTNKDDSIEDSYYEALGYKRKRADFTAVDELLLVRGVTPQIFDLIKDYITVYGDRININTASDKVLISIGLSPLIASQILQYRNGPDGIAGTKDDTPFSDINIENIFSGAISAQDTASISNLKNSFTTTSNYFRIESTGMMNKSKVAKKIIAIVKKEQGKIILKSYREY